MGPDRRRAPVPLPGELALPGVRHPRVRLVAPRVGGAVEPAARGVLPLRLGGQREPGPGGVGLRVLEADVGHRVAPARVRVAARALGAVPARAREPVPPAPPVVERHRPARGAEDERAGDEDLRVGVGVVGRVGRPLGERHVARRADEAAEPRHGHRGVLDPEARDVDPADRALLGIEVLAAHEERARLDPGHAGAGRRLGAEELRHAAPRGRRTRAPRRTGRSAGA